MDLLGDIIKGFDTNPAINNAFPGLRDALSLVKGGTITPEEYCRALLLAVQGHDVYKQAFEDLDPDMQEKVKRYAAGEEPEKIVKRSSNFYIPPSPAAKHHFKRMEQAGKTSSSRAWLNAKRGNSPVIYEDEAKTKVMKAHVDAPFENWGLNVKNTPAFTFVPTTVIGAQNLVKHAKSIGKRVRASGYRHSWSPIYSQDGEILVSMLDLEIATAVPDPSSLLPNAAHEGNDLKTIEVREDVPGFKGKKRMVRVGAAVTNEELRRWAIAKDEWSIPVNVILVEVTVAGVNSPICHGAGQMHSALSDYVKKIEYVDANGNLQTISDPEWLKAAAGSFGLLGIVTHITFAFDKMSYADMTPKKIPVNLAIPPPLEYYKKEMIPKQLRKKYSEEQLETARLDFVDRATKDYYSEWFWFPFQKEVFVNCWNTTEDRTGVIDYPIPPDVFFQWVQGWIGGILNDNCLFRALPGSWQAYLLGTLAHMAQPPNGPFNRHIRTYLPDALHFRRGIQNMRCTDFELEVPIPASKSDPTKPDYSVVQQAWWDAIIEAYADPAAPMRLAIELRIMGDSEMIMAPQNGNRFGTASIEVVSSMSAMADGSWGPYAQKVANRWMALKDANGAKLKVRPHWAKEWERMNVNGRPWREHLKKESYKDQIPTFIELLQEIGAHQGWTIEDVRQRFSNSLLDYMFFQE
ncbi:hypothetical protein L211DRAFT_796854 [Terfezia boudieri ATCC MYA-4762]|uniref:FAD-binding PCMH-type domain-containing protein n=1 Tax=Terfezia boudieri ATCC MYA-4762 TaxID=1051890 RepID=A0A3N4L6A9_9PEZI|nr:hypothetical protein L211DRAFT_796854 [Terfezia boudieri ATCC MYA-4762]